MDLNSHRRARRMPRPREVRAAAALAALLGASHASAFFDDRLQVFVGESLTHESNLFRLSDGAPGVSDKGDTYHATTVGFNLDTPVSRQRFQVGADWSQVRYNRYSSLDHTEHNGRLNWLWQGGDQWSGNLGYTESKTLASFLNFTGSTAPDPLRTQILSGSANYLLTPRWQLQAIGSEMHQRNELSVRQSQDIDLSSLQLGVNYLSPAGNSVGVDVRQDDGRYPNSLTLNGSPFSNNYVQRSVGALTNWAVTGKSHLSGRIDYLRREYDQVSSRDYSGGTFRLSYDWLATAKTSLNVVAQRDISPTEDLQTTFVLVKGVSVTPSYAFSDKLRFSASLSANQRDYLGDPGIAVGGGNLFAGRVDHLTTGMVSATYQPLRSLTLLLSAQHERRTSNISGLDYSANIINLNARLTF
ncbi:MAG TPA: XrtB/PEP-CTERM-associated polysaccharide biosynthesis outer membrane protein EpsL [Rhodocyclaceae bacterium]